MMEGGTANGKKAVDQVAHMKYLDELSKKTEDIAFKWQRDYKWLCDEYKYTREEMRKLCEEKNLCESNVEDKKDERSTMPFPKTTNGLYGWLAAKKDFILEQPGSWIVKYPNPLDEVTLIPGDVPTLAIGKGLV